MKKLVRALVEASGFSIFRLPPTGGAASVYHQDGLISIHNHDFMNDEAFCRAYNRGVRAANGDDYHWHWRVHVGLWAAKTAARLDGDFIECGVNRGVLSSAIMEYLDWNRFTRLYWLMDTFAGIDERFITDEERERAKLAESDNKLKSGVYTANFEGVKANFAGWTNIRFVRGSIPETLTEVTAGKVAFLHIDMNCAPPEIAALEYFWDRITPGGLVLLDDYAYRGFEPQKDAMDTLSGKLGAPILSLPTGQGLIQKTG